MEIAITTDPAFQAKLLAVFEESAPDSSELQSHSRKSDGAKDSSMKTLSSNSSTAWLTLALVTVVTSSAPGQTLTRDPVSGDFILRFTHDTITVETIVEAADQVSPALDVRLDSIGGTLRYAYLVRNATSARRAIHTVHIPCMQSDTLQFSAPPGRAVWARISDSTYVCEVAVASSEEDLLGPGQMADSLSVQSVRFPGIVTAKAYGLVNGAELGSSVTYEDLSPDVVRLLEQAQAVAYETGGGKAVFAVAPARLRGEFADPIAGLGLIDADRNRACTDLQWITSPSVCSTLGSQLTAARTAAQTSNWQAARAAIDAFLAELQIHRGSAVSENAYALLVTNARVVRSSMPT